MPLSFPNVEPRVFWRTEITAIPNQHWGGENLLCLTGDFNVHVDDLNDPAVCCFKVGCVSFGKLGSTDKDAFMDEIRNNKLFQMDTDNPDELPYLTIHCVPCWIVMLLLNLRILLVDHVFHG